MTTIQPNRSEEECTIATGLREHGFTDRQIVAGLKYYRKMLSRFEAYRTHPAKAVGPIVRNVENMKAGYS